MKRNYFILYSLFFLGIRVANTQNISTIAGNGSQGYFGDGGQATSAELYNPAGIGLDTIGNVYIADYDNNSIRKINVSSGIISTVAGIGTSGYSGDGGPATSAELWGLYGLVLDKAGDIYIADGLNNRIRKVTASTGIISTFAGNGINGFSGDGGPATSAELSAPPRVTLDASENLYIADADNNRIRKVNSSGTILTIAGNGISGYSGDGGQATAAELNQPHGVVIDASGDIYIADDNNNRIRKVNSSGIISTIAGNGAVGYYGDGGQATSAELNGPSGISLDNMGNIDIADANNNVIRELNVSTGIISTIIGNGTASYFGDGGPATSAELNFTTDVTLDASGNFYIADQFNNRIRKVTAPVVACVPNITTGLVAEYNFTGNANDVSGNGNNGTVYNATLTTDRFGNPNSAYYFNGVNAYIDVPNNASLDFSASNAMSISFWAVMDTTSVLGYSQVMVSKQSGSGTTQTGYDIEQYGGTSFYNGLRVGTSGGSYGGGSTTTTPSLFQWHHYVFTYDGTGGISTGYVDGVLEDSIGGNTAVIGASTFDLLFGEANWSNVNAAPFYGDLDDIYLYNRLLTSCDVDSLYNMPNIPTSISKITSLSNGVTIYPNPNKGTFTVALQNVTPKTQIEIYNVLGERVYLSYLHSNETEINMSGQAAGVYIYKVFSENGGVISNGKIVIQ